jgi:hypothetical protein
MRIPLWSETNPSAREVLSPLNTVQWDELSEQDKKRIWKYIQHHLFDPRHGSDNQYSFDGTICNYKFYGQFSSDKTHSLRNVTYSIDVLNDRHKRNSYASNYLNNSTFDNACSDFYSIFISSPKDVVFELLAIYSSVMVERDQEQIRKKQDEKDADYQARKEAEMWRRFDKFSTELNEVLQQFGINYQLTRTGIIPADEPKVIETIYEPTLKKLSAQKWAPVNRDLRDAFDALNKDKDGSGALTHALAALQGFLQVLVHDKTGKGDTSSLIKMATKSRKIPDDDFSKQIIQNLNSFWAKERQDKGDPHPKNVYATKQQAKLVISLVMVFVDHVL